MACEDCVKDQKKAQLIGVAAGVLLGSGIIVAAMKFRSR